MGGRITVSEEYFTIGKTSIKSSPDYTNKCSVDTVYVTTSEDIGKKIIFKFDTYSSDNINITLYYRLNSRTGPGVISSTISAPGNMTNNMILTLNNIVENTYSVSFRVTSNTQQPVYVDNVIVNIQ